MLQGKRIGVSKGLQISTWHTQYLYIPHIPLRRSSPSELLLDRLLDEFPTLLLMTTLRSTIVYEGSPVDTQVCFFVAWFSQLGGGVCLTKFGYLNHIVVYPDYRHFDSRSIPTSEVVRYSYY